MTTPAQPNEPEGEQRDLDEEARADALYFILRRTGLWAIPLGIVGALLVALGIPLWLTVIAMVTTLIILVFEIDF